MEKTSLQGKLLLALVLVFSLLAPASAVIVESDVVMWHSYDDVNVNATSIADVSSTDSIRVDGTLTGGLTCGDTGKVNEGCHMENSGEYIQGTQIGDIPLGDNDWTWGFWYQVASVASDGYVGGWGDSEADKTNAYQQSGVDLWIQHHTTAWDTGFNPSTGTWYYITQVYYAANNTEFTYINSVIQDSRVNLAAATAGGGLQIGKRPDLDQKYCGATEKCKFDEMVILDRPATQAEVDSLYNSGSGVNYSSFFAPPVAGEPTLAYVAPTPANSTISRDNIAINITFTNTTPTTSLSISIYNTTNELINKTILSTGVNNYFLNFTNLPDATYYFNASGIQDDSKSASVGGNRTITIDTTPPALATSLTNTTNEFTLITWTWTNPGDSDLNDTLVFLNGTQQTVIGNATEHNASVICGTDNLISVRHRDVAGNTNGGSNSTVKSRACPGVLVDLQLYYEFNDADGGPYLDSTNNGNTGTATGIPTQVSGRQGFGVDFVGDANVFINSTLNLSTMTGNQFSIMTWLNSDSFNTNGDNIWSSKNISGTGATLYYNNSLKGYALDLVNDSGGVCHSGLFGAKEQPVNAWQQLILSFNGQRTSLFINGTLLNSTLTDCPITAQSDWLTINRRYKGFGQGLELDGQQDEFAVWNRSLGQTDVDFLWNSGVGRSYTFLTTGGVSPSSIFIGVGVPDNTTASFTHNATTGFITYTWNDEANQLLGAFFTTIVYNTTGAFLVNTNATSGSSGTLKYNVTPYLDLGWDVYAVAYLNDTSRLYVYGDTVTAATLYISPDKTVPSAFSNNDGAFYTFLIIFFFATIGLLLRSASAMIVLVGLGLIFTSTLTANVSMGFINTIIGMGIILLWLLSKARST